MANLLERFDGVLDPDSEEAHLITQLDPKRLPAHIAVIMDGNGRWARRRHLPRVEGHRAGIQAVRAAVECAARLGIGCITLYAFSVENWKRPAGEVNTLWELLKQYLRRELKTLQRHDIRFRAIGRLSQLPSSVTRGLRAAEKATRNNQGMTLTIALNYSGRLELVDAFNRLLDAKARSPVSEADVEQNLYTAGYPPLDLLIRTSGEMRVSNFLLWQIAYAEICVLDVLWPDFRTIHLVRSLLEYQRRERRYGGLRSSPLPAHRSLSE